MCGRAAGDAAAWVVGWGVAAVAAAAATLLGAVWWDVVGGVVGSEGMGALLVSLQGGVGKRLLMLLEEAWG